MRVASCIVCIRETGREALRSALESAAGAFGLSTAKVCARLSLGAFGFTIGCTALDDPALGAIAEAGLVVVETGLGAGTMDLVIT